MLHIRPLLESDLPAALHLSTQAGWNQLARDWLRLLRLFPSQCLAGCLHEQLIATATLATYENRLGWIGMILVDPAHRSKGHGIAMFDAILALADQLAIPTLALDATDLGEPLYRKRGFLPSTPINRWLTPIATHSHRHIPTPCPTPSESDWPDILALDHASANIDRSPLLGALAGEPNARLRILRESCRLVGFAFARPGRFHRPLPQTSPDSRTSPSHEASWCSPRGCWLRCRGASSAR